MYWRRTEKIKLSQEVTNEKVIERIGDNRTLINIILVRNANWIGHFLKRICLLDEAIEVQMMEVKGVGRIIIQVLVDLRNRRYWELKIEIVRNDSLPIEHKEEVQMFFH